MKRKRGRETEGKEGEERKVNKNITVTKHVQDGYGENYQLLIKKMKEI